MSPVAKGENAIPTVIRNLDHHRLRVEIEEAEAVDDILVRPGDEGFLWLDVVRQHGDAPAERGWQLPIPARI